MSITKLKLRNLAPRPEKPLASLRKLFWDATPPPALSIGFRWGDLPPMHTGARQYPQAGETSIWPDRFTFEHVVERSSIKAEQLELSLLGIDHAALAPPAAATAAATAVAAPPAAASAYASHAAPTTPRALGTDGGGGGAVQLSGGSAAAAYIADASTIGQLAIPIATLASGPTRNDHPLCAPAAGAPPDASAGRASGGEGADAESERIGARIAFRCRVSELREWRIALDKVRVTIKPDALEPEFVTHNPSRAFLFALSYIFTSGSTDQSSHEREWHAPTSQLRLAAPGAELELGWDSMPRRAAAAARALA